MKKVVIVGFGGAGKSTLAQKLGELLKLPVIHLDNHYWQPGWVETERPIWQQIQLDIMQQPRWIIDGNNGSNMNDGFAEADTIIYLDLNRYLCIWRAVKRRIKYHGRSRPDMKNGCQERLDFQFLTWLWRYPKDTHPVTLARLEKVPAAKTVIRLRSRRQVKVFLTQLANE